MNDNPKVQKTSLAWLDDSTNNAEEHNTNQQQLRLIDSNFKMLKSKDECKEYINSQSTDARITLIVNGKLGREIVPEIREKPQIAAIYVYCMNKNAHEQWALKIDKVKGVFTEFNDLKKQLQPNQTSKKNSIITEMPPPDTLPPDTPPPEPAQQLQSTYELDSFYMISDSCFDYLVRMKMLPSEKDDFISLCQDAFQGNNSLLAILQEFKESYTANRAISWLNRYPFFHEFIDNIFKCAHIDAMYSSRVFIHDIQKQLEQHKCTSTIQVYYSRSMSNENFEELKNSNGKIIAMKSFFLTNLDRETALLYTSNSSSSDGNKRILFIIEANPQIENVKPFAKIGSLSDTNDANDVLFMIGSLFKITEIQDEKDGIINIKITLCANDDENTLKALFDELKYRYIDSNGETNLIGFGQLLCGIGNSIRDGTIFDKGEKFIHSCLDKLSADHLDRPSCYDALGNIDLLKGDLDSSLNWYKKSFEIRKEKLQANDPNLAQSYKSMASIYLQKQDFTQAFEYFKQLLIIWKQLYGDDHISLMFCYTNMASIHEVEGRLSEAISCYHQALAIMVKYDSLNSASFAALYYNLGNVYTCYNQYHLALGFYNASLQLKLTFHPLVHPSIATTYKNIGLVYGYMNNVQQSRENFEKAVEIYRELYPSDNTYVTDIEEHIRNLPS